MSFCRQCDDSRCRNCLETCHACDEYACSRCRRACKECGEITCTGCLEDNLCPDCREKVEKPDDSTDSTQSPEPAVEPVVCTESTAAQAA